ncbi:MAG TPA: hypothetical protein VIU85_04260 [Chthoniobacterales bacterium]
MSVSRIIPAKIDPNVEGGTAVRGIEVVPIGKDRVASSTGRRRKKGDRIVLTVRKEVSEDPRTAVIETAKIDIIIIDRARRLRRNHFRRLR